MVTPGAQPPVNSMRVLHIDDDPDYLAITKMYLESFDPEMEVVSSLSPIESLPLIESMQFDCVVCDYLIPEMDGIELCRRVRKTSQVPFIIHTGRGSEEVASIAFDAGVDDYIRKEPGRSQYRVLANRVRQAVEKDRVERLYRSVLESSRDGIIIIQGTRIVYANQAMADIIGISSHEELLGTDVLEWVVDRDKRRLQSAALSRQQGDSPPSNYEVSFLRPDGEHRVVDISSSLINYMGRPASLGIVRDVSETARARERLASLHNCTIELASAESIEEVAKQTLDSIEEVFDFRWGDFSILEAGRVIPVHFKGVTYDKLEILNLDGPGVITRAARTGESQLVPDTRMDEDYLPTLIDGGITPLSELAVPIKSNGNVIGVINLESPALDRFSIDDQKLLEIFAQYVASAIIRIKNEGFLKASEEKYRNILESSLDGVTVTKDTKFIFTNQRFAEMLGYDDPSELLGRSSWDLIAPEFQALIQEKGLKRREGDRSTFRYEITHVRKDGSPFYVESQTSAIDFEGEPAVLGVHRDINEKMRLREESRRSEELIKSFMGSATDRFAIFDSELNYLDVNKAVETRSGHPKEYFIGKNILDVLPGLKETGRIERYKDVIETGNSAIIEGKHASEKGQYLSIDAFKVGDGLGVITRDISERKRLEMNLVESETRWRTLVELAPDGIITFNVLGFVTSINDAFVRLTGFSKDEIVGKHFTKMGTLRARDMPIYMKLFAALLKGEIPPPYDFEYRRKDGSMGWGQAHMRSIKVGDKSREILLILREISERKRLEEELLESEERHRALVELSPQGIMVIDSEGFIRSANPAVVKHHGYSSSEIVGKHFTELPYLDKSDLPQFREGFKSMLEGKGQLRYEYKLNHKDGTERWAVASFGVLKNQGRIDGFLTVINDITERKLMEESLRVNQERLHAFMESSPVSFAVFDSDLKYLVVNKHLLDLYGFAREDLIGKRMSEIHPDSKKSGREELYQEVIRTGEPIFIPEARSPSQLDDQVFSVWGFKVGEGMGLVSMNITENKKNEDELRESEERYRSLFALSPYAIVISDLKGNITDVNDVVSQMAGYPKDELIGKHFSRLPMLNKRDIPRYLKIFSYFLRGNPTGPQEIQVQSRDGITGILEMHVGFVDVGGEKVGIQAVFKDVTIQKKIEAELRRSEKRYRSLIELAPEGIMTINLKGVVTSINTAYTRLTGHSKNEIVGKHFTKLQTATSLKDMPKYIKMFTAMLRGKTPPLVEFDFKRKDGTLRRGETISQIVEVEPGMREVLTIHRDITERKHMEEELRTHSERLEERITERTSELKESEERFRNVIDNLPMGVHMYKIDANGDLRFIAANPTADKMDSIPSSAYIGMTLDEGFPNVDNEIKERFKEIAEKGGYWHEEDIRYKDDRISNATDNYIFQTAPGEMASIFRDITEQKQMEEEIRSLARFPGEDTNPVLRISGDGVLIYANAAAESVLSEWKTQVGMKAPEEWIRYVSAALEEGRLDVEIKISDRVLSMCLLSIEDAGYVNVYSRDVTDEKRMEEDLLSTERLATAGRVAAMMGHDLRGPLVVVRNAVNVARENPEQTDRMLDMIDRNTGQAMDILEELRTRTRDEPVTLTSIEIRTFLDEATEDLFLPDEVELHIEIAEELSVIVLDKVKTLRALDNLIRNAIDAMPNGGIIKLVATRETDQFVISVSDTGTGVPDEIQKNLFKPFYTTKPGGMGLGLASTRRMVAVQGGTISFETKAGEGSTFSITLPLREKNTE